jgi:threonine 3-dehydrogenase
MIHAAAQGRPYTCFVREDMRILFLAMPDAITALLALLDAPAESLTTLVYNIMVFNPSAGEIAKIVRTTFPRTELTFAPDPPTGHRGLVAEDVDDTRAPRRGFRPSMISAARSMSICCPT